MLVLPEHIVHYPLAGRGGFGMPQQLHAEDSTWQYHTAPATGSMSLMPGSLASACSISSPSVDLGSFTSRFPQMCRACSSQAIPSS